MWAALMRSSLRNVPPRPDNYAQRGGRAGRRSRVGMVIGYARNTPHDQYFYDKPREMIAGEVPAPARHPRQPRRDRAAPLCHCLRRSEPGTFRKDG